MHLICITWVILCLGLLNIDLKFSSNKHNIFQVWQLTIQFFIVYSKYISIWSGRKYRMVLAIIARSEVAGGQSFGRWQTDR